MAQAETKRTYQAPSIKDAGSVLELTLQHKIAPKDLDALFPSGTPFQQLTFS